MRNPVKLLERASDVQIEKSSKRYHITATTAVCVLCEFSHYIVVFAVVVGISYMEEISTKQNGL